MTSPPQPRAGRPKLGSYGPPVIAFVPLPPVTGAEPDLWAPRVAAYRQPLVRHRRVPRQRRRRLGLPRHGRGALGARRPHGAALPRPGEPLGQGQHRVAAPLRRRASSCRWPRRRSWRARARWRSRTRRRRLGGAAVPERPARRRGRYDLTTLLRGQLGTEGAMGDPVPAGARVVVLDANSARRAADEPRPGRARAAPALRPEPLRALGPDLHGGRPRLPGDGAAAPVGVAGRGQRALPALRRALHLGAAHALRRRRLGRRHGAAERGGGALRPRDHGRRRHAWSAPCRRSRSRPGSTRRPCRRPTSARRSPPTRSTSTSSRPSSAGGRGPQRGSSREHVAEPPPPLSRRQPEPEDRHPQCRAAHARRAGQPPRRLGGAVGSARRARATGSAGSWRPAARGRGSART